MSRLRCWPTSSREQKDTGSRPSPLTNLPPELLDEVISNLLAATHVPPREDSSVRYCFETSIMRTSRAIAAKAQEVFHRNNFIVVRARPEILRHLENNHLPLWYDRWEQMQQWNCRITFTSVVNDTSCAIFAQSDLDIFLKVLQMISLAIRPSFQLDIEVKVFNDTLRKLGQLRGRGQTCIISGATQNQELSLLARTMSPLVHWVRAEARLFLALCDWKMTRAQLFVAKSNWVKAHLMLRDLDSFVREVRNRDLDFLRQPDDPALKEAFDRLQYLVFVNAALISMNMVFHTQPPRRADLQNVCSTVVNRWPTKIPLGIPATVSNRVRWLLTVADTYLRLIAAVPQTEPAATHYTQYVVRMSMHYISRQLFMLQQPPVSILKSFDNEIRQLQAANYAGEYYNGSMTQQMGEASVAQIRTNIHGFIVGPGGPPSSAFPIPRYPPHPPFRLYMRRHTRFDRDGILRYAGEA